jgi:hypothetical protein
MKFPSTLDQENPLAYEVSDEALETAGASCTGLSVCPG